MPLFALSQQEADALLNSTDPVVAAAAKKLKATEEGGEFVPKSRLTQEHIKAAKKILGTSWKSEYESLTSDKLNEVVSAFELEVATKEQERLRKAGDFETLLATERGKTETERIAREKVEKQLNELKPLADQATKLRENVLKIAKEKLGPDKWLPEYDNFSLESLGKLVPESIIGTEKAPGGPTPKTNVKEMDQKAFDQLHNDVLNGKRVALQ